MRAAIYARCSTGDQDESTTVQRGNALKYIERNGWSLDQAYVYVDEAISRAEFQRRGGLAALLNAAERGEFDVVVVRDESRFGGDMIRAGLAMQDLADAGVRLFYYFTDEEVRLDGATNKFLQAAKNFAAELEREKASERTYEHLQAKAAAGFVAGGVVYGYDNVRPESGGPASRVIKAEQAEVVVEIFERYARGQGQRAIARDLNARGVPPPRAGKRGTGSWAQSCIRAILLRDLYQGVVIYGRTQKGYRKGTKVRLERPEHERTTLNMPELRIVSESLWDAVQARFEANKRHAPAGRSGPPSPYLLTGLARCGECGGPICVTNRRSGRQSVKAYGCAYHRDRGPAVCSNAVRRPVEAVDAVVTGWVRKRLLSEETVQAALEEVRRRLSTRLSKADDQVPALEARARKLRAEIDRLTDVIATGEAPPEGVMRGIRSREDQLKNLDAQLRGMKAAPSAIDLELRRMEKESEARLDALSRMFDDNVQEAKAHLKRCFRGPIIMTPVATGEGNRYQVEGLTAVGAMFIEPAGRSLQSGGAAPDGFSTDGVPSVLLSVLNWSQGSESAEETLAPVLMRVA